jgi:transcriptional regulator with XRE-family HTH domain
VRLKAKRTDPRLPKELRTLGDHIRKRRLELGLLQREVAELLGADPQSVNAWERNYRQPALHRLQAIAAFLGYDPENVSDDTPIGLQLASKRRRLGFSQKALAELLGIDEGTLRRSERGRRLPSTRRSATRLRNGFQNKILGELTGTSGSATSCWIARSARPNISFPLREGA